MLTRSFVKQSKKSRMSSRIAEYQCSVVKDDLYTTQNYVLVQKRTYSDKNHRFLEIFAPLSVTSSTLRWRNSCFLKGFFSFQTMLQQTFF